MPLQIHFCEIDENEQIFESKPELFFQQGFIFNGEFVFLITMALEIRRTPVLYGEDAKRFLKEIENPQTSKFTKEEIEESFEQAKRFLDQLRAQEK
jgi:hypothetical protein